jgi:hypothetical protein
MANRTGPLDVSRTTLATKWGDGRTTHVDSDEASAQSSLGGREGALLVWH